MHDTLDARRLPIANAILVFADTNLPAESHSHLITGRSEPVTSEY
jgi:hypothetical protein